MQSIDKIDNKRYQAKLTTKKEIAQDTHEFTFELEHEMKFEPGQYVWVEIPNMYATDAKGNRRAFSLVNTPATEKSLTIIFRSTKSGFNESLRLLNPGDELVITGPFGSSFCLPEEPQTPLVLIAGGVGVAPFLSLIRYSVEIGSTRNIILFTTNDSIERTPYAKELDALVQKSKSIKVVNLLRRLEDSDATEIFKLKDALLYVSGPQGFVNDVHGLLKTDGIFDHQFHFEAFYPSTFMDQKITQLFLDGHPNFDPNELPYNRLREELIYGLINYSATHTIITDTHGRIVFANQAAQDITGYTLSEMLGQTPRLWGGMMTKKFYAELWHAKLRGEVFSAEIINRRKNGDIYVSSTHIAPVKDKKGIIIGYVGSEEDITYLRKAEQKATENEQRFIQLTDRISEIYWIIDLSPSIRVAYVSPTFEKIWGIPREILYQNPYGWVDGLHHEDKERVLSTFDLLVKQGTPFNIEFRIVRPDGSVSIVRAEGEHMLDENGKISRIFGMIRDITKEKTIDKEKTEFVSFASHQFKTPITAIRWNIESLLAGKYGKLEPKQEEVLKGIYTMNVRIDELISNLLNVSRIEQGVFLIEPSPTDFIKICEEVLLESEPYLEKKGHSLTKNFDAGLPAIPADPKLLRIIFQNFISNAIKYTPEKGRIVVSLKVLGNDVVFSVMNNGDPIPEAEQAKIFQKMFRASNAPEQDPGGTGLGLYIVKQIVENSGGRVWFTSKKEEGTIFSASFPLSGMVRKQGAKELV